jgi:hypothetical protein
MQQWWNSGENKNIGEKPLSSAALFTYMKTSGTEICASIVENHYLSCDMANKLSEFKHCQKKLR